MAPVVVPAALGAVGFGAAGPVVGMFHPVSLFEATSKPLEPIGSIAAGMQAGVRDVAAASLLAAAQSIAMGGGVPAALSAVAALGAAAAAILQ
jgi:hypothetical protein